MDLFLATSPAREGTLETSKTPNSELATRLFGRKFITFNARILLADLNTSHSSIFNQPRPALFHLVAEFILVRMFGGGVFFLDQIK